jgi:hypothetical protein
MAGNGRHAGPAHAAGNLSPDERAALDEIRRRKAAGAEVICVIRSRSNPQAESEILVLEHASPQFLQQLAAETGQSGQTRRRQLTSLEVPGGQRNPANGSRSAENRHVAPRSNAAPLQRR